MNVLAINGSPRKNGNTATLLGKALEGAASKGANTELIHLYDLNFKGCVSCFACKLKDGKSYGKCAVKDDLAPILQRLEDSDALILGSPIYFGDVTGEMRSFIERLAFPYLVYDENYTSLFPKKMPLGIIYTMNVDESRAKEYGYEHILARTEMSLARHFATREALCSYDTYQFSDYSKYVVTAFNEADKLKRHQEKFPNDCKQAFEMGVRFATKEVAR